MCGIDADNVLDKSVHGRELEAHASSITDSLLSSDNETHFVPRVGFVKDKDERLQDVQWYNHSLLKGNFCMTGRYLLSIYVLS